MSIYIEDNKTHTVRSYYTSPKIEETIEILLRSNEELMHSETLPGYKVDFVEEEHCEDAVNKAETEVKMSDFTEEEWRESEVETSSSVDFTKECEEVWEKGMRKNNE